MRSHNASTGAVRRPNGQKIISAHVEIAVYRSSNGRQHS
jgi:hypothetical protein